MNELQIVPVTSDEMIKLAADLAREIWTQHFPPIIGEEQVEYMLNKFQSHCAISTQIKEGYEYFLLTFESDPIGYCGIHDEKEALFLSKIYIKQSYRGKGFSSAVIQYLKNLCKERGLSHIWLTCNKHNADSISAYEHMGFVITRTQVADIGNGFVMDDYIMEMSV